MKIRNRACIGANVGSRQCPANKAIETQPCGGFPCARWAEWNSWSPCSKTCGQSQQVRVRTCIFGQIGDDGCKANDAKEEQACQLSECGKTMLSKFESYFRQQAFSPEMPLICDTGAGGTR